jgi:myotubularin-related protein 6/7/8
VQDEKLVEAIFQSHHSPHSPFVETKVYGATATNLITDARPTTNAMATFAKGAGTENMDHYKDARKVYLGVDNIHVMRDSLSKVIEALREADIAAAALPNIDGSRPLPPDDIFLDRQALRRSGWLRYISALLDGTLLVVRNIHVNSSHVLIHCSDGWDRTTQLSSLAQLCLDPFYRTMRGFEILIEKDWLSFGHRFLDRCGHLSSEKFFLTAGSNDNTGGAEAAQAFLASVQNKFTPQHHLKETSPVFHQFLECVRQIQRQFPTRFEFNQRFLERLHYHLYSCQFGTFLHNNEQERRVDDGGKPPCERTVSAWDWFNSPEEMEKNRNPEYDTSLDNPKSRSPDADMGVLFPNPKDVRFWHELYGRSDEEMNGRIVIAQAAGVEILGPIESAEDDPIAPPAEIPSEPQSSPSTPPSAATSDRIPQTNGLGTTLGSTSSPPHSTRSERPPITRGDGFKPFGTVNSAYTLQPPTSESAQSEAGPSSLPQQSRQGGPALPKLPDAFTGGGLRSMWGKLSSNASAALSGVRDAYEGVAKDLVGSPGSPSANPDLPARGGELQVTDSTNKPWGDRAEDLSSHPTVTLNIDDNPWASLKQKSSSGAPRTQLLDDFDGHSSSPVTSLPHDPTVAQPTPLSYSSSPFAVSRPYLSTPSRGSDTLHTSMPYAIPLPISRSPSLVSVPGVEPPSSQPLNGQQSDPLGVGWL